MGAVWWFRGMTIIAREMCGQRRDRGARQWGTRKSPPDRRRQLWPAVWRQGGALRGAAYLRQVGVPLSGLKGCAQGNAVCRDTA